MLDDKGAAINVVFEKKLGVSRERCVEHIRLVKLMAWEQVLLLAWYARSQYFSKDTASHFHARLKLLKLVKQHYYDRLLPPVSELLDEGVGFLAISERVKHISDTDSSLQMVATSLLRRCEEEQITFASLNEPPVYSYQSMLAALEEIVDIFRELLKGQRCEKWCDAVVLDVLNSNYSRPVIRGSKHDLFAKAFQTLPEALEKIREDQELGRKISLAIDEALGQWMSNVFKLASYPLSPNSGDPHPYNNRVKKICEIAQNIRNNELTLVFDREYLARCMAIGQERHVMESIRDQLKAFLGEQVLEAGVRDGQSQVALSQWYKHCAVIGLRRESSIPARVAALLEFDIRHSFHEFGFFHHHFRMISREQFSNSDSAVLATAIIDRCLFHAEAIDDIKPEADEIHVSLQGYIETITSCVAEEASRFGDPIMKDWSDREPKKLKERFKRPRAQVEKDILSANKLIREQMSKGMDSTYPLGGHFPLPLWQKSIQ